MTTENSTSTGTLEWRPGEDLMGPEYHGDTSDVSSTYLQILKAHDEVLRTWPNLPSLNRGYLARMQVLPIDPQAADRVFSEMGRETQ
jgi:hypothetical protein